MNRLRFFGEWVADCLEAADHVGSNEELDLIVVAAREEYAAELALAGLPPLTGK